MYVSDAGMKGAFLGSLGPVLGKQASERRAALPSVWYHLPGTLLPLPVPVQEGGDLHRALPPKDPCPPVPRPLPLQPLPFPGLIPSPAPFFWLRCSVVIATTCFSLSLSRQGVET